MRKMRGIQLSYEQQGLVYFICQTFPLQPHQTQDKILRLCMECGGEYEMALFLVLTTRESVQSIAQRHHVSTSVLYGRRKRFYERWYKERNLYSLYEAES